MITIKLGLQNMVLQVIHFRRDNKKRNNLWFSPYFFVESRVHICSLLKNESKVQLPLTTPLSTTRFINSYPLLIHTGCDALFCC